jgi:cyclophilin family peptidyl-prolyl cis-trans isomerase
MPGELVSFSRSHSEVAPETRAQGELRAEGKLRYSRSLFATARSMRFATLFFAPFLRLAVVVSCGFVAANSALRADPVIADIPAQSVPCGKSLVVPVKVDGVGPMTFSVKSSTGKIIPLVKTGNPYLKISVSYAGDGGSSAAFSGDLVFQLFRDLTPKTAGFIAGCAQAGFYNGLDFYRVLTLTGSSDGFIAQGGSNANVAQPPNFDNEFALPLIFVGKGQLAMANQDGTAGYVGTNNTSFFITEGPLRFLDFKHTIFGQLVRGFDVLDKIVAVPTDVSDAPNVKVVMQNVSVIEDNTDAVLLVSATDITGANPATVTVTARDANGATSSKQFSVSAFADTVNDPPILKPTPDIVSPLMRPARVAILGEDLEFDYLFPGAQILYETANATGQFQGNVVVLSPDPASPRGLLQLGVEVHQLGSVLRTDPSDHTLVNVGFGDGRLTAQNMVLTGSAGAPLTTGTVATFSDADPHGTATDFAATINWGDGSPLTSESNVSITPATFSAPTAFAASAPHTYSSPGIYPVTITVGDVLGSIVNIEETAVISGGALAGVGQSLTAGNGMVSNRMLATFTDSGSPAPLSAYRSVIDWGDGSTSPGIVRKSSRRLAVYGSHKYVSNMTSTVNVALTKTPTSEAAHAWSTVKPMHVSAVAFPPFPQSHVVGEISQVTKSNDILNASVYLVNTGNKTSGPITLKFYLSSDATLDTAADTPLTVNGSKAFIVQPQDAGRNASGSLPVRLPAGTVSKDKYLLMQISASDPIGDHMLYDRVFASPQLTQ